MKLNILYFGLIAEAIKTTNETLFFEKGVLVGEVLASLIQKYPVLQKLNYQVAVNKKITLKKAVLSTDSEIALLPPFAGG